MHAWLGIPAHAGHAPLEGIDESTNLLKKISSINTEEETYAFSALFPLTPIVSELAIVQTFKINYQRTGWID